MRSRFVNNCDTCGKPVVFVTGGVDDCANRAYVFSPVDSLNSSCCADFAHNFGPFTVVCLDDDVYDAHVDDNKPWALLPFEFVDLSELLNEHTQSAIDLVERAERGQ